MKNFFNSQFSIFKSEDGQSLITLLFFMVIGITVISAAALIVAADILSASNAEQGLSAYYVAESGIENGTLYLLRHPQYNGPDIAMPIGTGNATIHFVYDGAAKTDTITSTGTNGTTTRVIRAVGSYTTGPLSITSWKEQ
ncbi:MAG TPA: hypothetical protein VEW42_01065 [Candidatus Eisenbacteria bacterium]|nr:hypothetical protein [Candidatus Eisenbacteria bacterium]